MPEYIYSCNLIFRSYLCIFLPPNCSNYSMEMWILSSENLCKHHNPKPNVFVALDAQISFLWLLRGLVGWGSRAYDKFTDCSSSLHFVLTSIWADTSLRKFAISLFGTPVSSTIQERTMMKKSLYKGQDQHKTLELPKLIFCKLNCSCHFICFIFQHIEGQLNLIRNYIKNGESQLDCLEALEVMMTQHFFC